MRIILCIITLALCTAGFTQAAPPAPKPAAPSTSTLKSFDAGNHLIGEQPNPEAAQPWRSTPATSVPETRNAVWDTVNWIFRLLLVLGFAYLFALLLRRIFAPGAGPAMPLLGPPPSRNMRILETVSLGQGRTVHLIAVGERRLLIGVTNAQISLLDDVTGEITPGAAPPESPTGTPFLSMLGGLLHKPETPPKEGS
jgi:flagellar biosynthetic protein FliO